MIAPTGGNVLLMMDNIQLGIRVERRLDWPQSYGLEDIHPPANKKGKVIAYSDEDSVIHGETNDFINA